MLNRIIKKMRIIFSNNDNYIKLLRKSGVKIGEECEIYKDVVFGSEPYLIEIGDHVRITNGCKFITHDGGVWVIRQLMDDNEIDLFGKIIVGNNVHIGMNCIIMPNVKIGNNVIIGCGAVVTKDIPDGEIWGGVPAKFIKQIDDYYDKHKSNFEHTKRLSVENKKSYLKNKLG